MIAIGDKLVKITQEGQSCSFAVSATSQSIPANGYSGSVSVTAPGSCNWTAVSNVDWITVFYGESGFGNGKVYYRAEPNNGTSTRTGTLTIAGKTVSISQAGAAVSRSKHKKR
jgi:hypothetical protein